MKALLIIVSFGLLLGACKKSETKLRSDEYLIFGHFFGQCVGGTCVEYFKLTKNKVYEDTKDNYAASEFNFVEMDGDKFDIADGLVEWLPTELIESPDSTFGCPDCADQGGVFIQYKKDGALKTWRLDNFTDNIPASFVSFMSVVKEKIDALSE